MTENWRPVVGYEGMYSVSDQGRVRSESRTVLTTLGPRRYQGKDLKPYRLKNHRVVTLSDRKTQRRKWLVHRLVLEAFVGPCPSGLEGCHRNDTGYDNRLSNLYWGTASDNMTDRVRNGRHHNAVKTHCKRDHEFTRDNTRYLPNGARNCITCHQERRSR